MEVTALIDSQVLHPCLSLCTLCVAGPPCANAPYAACFQSCACLTAISFCSHLFIFVMLDCVAHVKLAMAFVRSFQRFKSMFAYTCVCVFVVFVFLPALLALVSFAPFRVRSFVFVF